MKNSAAVPSTAEKRCLIDFIRRFFLLNSRRNVKRFTQSDYHNGRSSFLQITRHFENTLSNSQFLLFTFPMNSVFAFALGIGFASGLRALTPPAIVAWAAHLGWMNLNDSPFAFIGS